MYETRLKPSGLEVETVWHKNDEDLIRNVNADQSKQHSVVLLDPKGKMCTSEEFCEQLYEWLDQGGSRLAFVIGGAEGLPEDLRQSSITKLSLSKLTFTHQFARTLLMEQIYRASEIRKGSGYHK
jgi:23S rRNA (pseudouridine1915-N3)-methyltransferase